MAGVTAFATGTQLASVGTEHTLNNVNAAGEYTCAIEIPTAFTTGDVVELRAYKMVLTGGTSALIDGFPVLYAGPQNNASLLVSVMGPFPNELTDTDSIKFTIKQTFGTGRSFKWAILNKNDGLITTTTNVTNAVTLAAAQKVDVDTIKTNPVVNAGTATFPTNATLASTTNISAGTVTTTTNVTNAPPDSSGVSTLLIRIPSAITVTGGLVSADIKSVNADAVKGSGAAGDTWGPV